MRRDGDLAAAADLYRAGGGTRAAALRRPGSRSARRARRSAIATGARAAFEQARAADPRGPPRRGAASRAARRRRSGDRDALHGYVRTLFDQYAPRFDRALEDLGYRGAGSCCAMPSMAARATRFRHACSISAAAPGSRARRSGRMSTGWSGVDLSPKMIEEARQKGLYDRLAVGDIAQFLGRAGRRRRVHLVIAADVFAYVGGSCRRCAPRSRACSRRRAVRLHGRDP